jgi:acetyl/propionyl-CoA carboxylase alpha subunit
VEIIQRIPQLTRLSFDDVALDITSDGNAYAVSLDGRTYRVEVLRASNGRLDLLIDGRHVAAYISSDGQNRWVTINSQTVVLTKTSASRRASTGHAGSSELTAPMPGQVRTVNVSEGDVVTKGEVLVVLEAMKMEIRLQASFDGIVSAVEARVGQTVEREQVLIKIQQGQAT